MLAFGAVVEALGGVFAALFVVFGEGAVHADDLGGASGGLALGVDVEVDAGLGRLHLSLARSWHFDPLPFLPLFPLSQAPLPFSGNVPHLLPKNNLRKTSFFLFFLLPKLFQNCDLILPVL